MAKHEEKKGIGGMSVPKQNSPPQRRPTTQTKHGSLYGSGKAPND